MRELTLSGELVFIEGHPVEKIHGGFGDSQPCILAKQVAELHNYDLGEINRIVNRNAGWFEDGIDIIDLAMVSNHSQKTTVFLLNFYSRDALNASKYIYLFSQQGYALLCKLLKSDLAKQIYKQMVREYFGMRERLETIGAGTRIGMEQLDMTVRCFETSLRALELAGVSGRGLKREIANEITKHVVGVDLMDFIYPYLFSVPKRAEAFSPPAENGNEEEILGVLVSEWREKYGEKPVPSRDLWKLIDDGGIPLNLGTGGERSRKIRLGKMLAKLAGREIGDHRIVDAGKRKGVRVWRLENI